MEGTARSPLFSAILGRRSIRRYDARPLDNDMLTTIRQIVDNTQPLELLNGFGVLMKDVVPGVDLVSTLGGYGRLVSPPHFLVPHVQGGADQLCLVELGYRMEQVAVHLAGLGIGSCFIGSLGRESQVRSLYNLSQNTRVAAFLIFGRPSRTRVGSAVNSLMRLSTGATRKLRPEQVFYAGDFSVPARPPADLFPLVEAGCSAPSAVDAQPWRFLWRDGMLHLFVKVRSLRYGPGIRQDYRLHDGGACMANVTLALAALGRSGRWRLYGDEGLEAPAHPRNLQPLAVLQEA